MVKLVAIKKMMEAQHCYPPTKEGCLGNKRSDHGVLPLDHPEIEKLSDPIHFIKNYKSKLYNLVQLSKERSDTCQADALKLSRNLLYMLAQHTPDGSKADESELPLKSVWK
jgi:hypothetical protein